MWEQITSNKWKSGILVFFFVAFVIFLGWLFGETTVWGPYATVLAVIVASVGALVSWYNSDKMVLAISRARPAEKSQYPHLYNSVEGLAIAAGIPMPKLYVIDDSAPNAFATGRDPEHAAIAVTTGLLDKLNRVELEGVIGHEMSHIADRDTLLMTITVVMVGTVALVSDWMMRSFLWGGRRRRVGGGGQAGAIIMLVAIVLGALLAELEVVGLVPGRVGVALDLEPHAGVLLDERTDRVVDQRLGLVAELGLGERELHLVVRQRQGVDELALGRLLRLGGLRHGRVGIHAGEGGHGRAHPLLTGFVTQEETPFPNRDGHIHRAVTRIHAEVFITAVNQRTDIAIFQIVYFN